jgi:hypothetical protein
VVLRRDIPTYRRCSEQPTQYRPGSDADLAAGRHGLSVRALIAPSVVRALRSADAMGDALIARGVDD